MKICSLCVMDETVPNITFSDVGVCQYCTISDKIKNLTKKNISSITHIKDKIINSSKNSKYNCIAGVSGGRDSTFLLYVLKKKLNLNPLAVHYDNGWNTELSNNNIKNVCEKLDIDLYTEVANWKSFSVVQNNLIKACVPDVETITELGIYKTLFEAAKKFKCKYITTGHNIDNEFLDPLFWTYFDGRYIKSICKKNDCLKELKNLKIFYLTDLISYQLINGIKIENVTNLFDYNHGTISEVLTKECGWEPYKGHHQESNITKFVNEYYLPKKFKIDKRKTNLSARIRSGLIKRNKAIEILKSSSYQNFDKSTIDFVLKKLNISEREFEEILLKENKNFTHFENYYFYFKLFSPVIKILGELNLINPYLYYKYNM